MEVDATSPAIGSHVQFVSVPEEGVPRTGLVRVGLVRVLFVRVSVVARPTYVSVPWNVIVVLSVPEKVSVFVKLSVFPAVPVSVYVPVVNVFPLTVVGVIAPREIVNAPSEFDADTPLAVVTRFTSVPVVAGRVCTVAVPATAVGWIVTSPEVFPNILTFPIVVTFTPSVRTDTPSVMIPATTFVSVVPAPRTIEFAVSDHPVAVTVPDHPGVAQVPSPLQNVEADADVPLLRFPTGRFPVTPVERGSHVALVSTSVVGVPRFGVMRVGEVEKTIFVEVVPVVHVADVRRLSFATVVVSATPHTLGRFVISRSVVQSFVTRDPVIPIDPVIVMSPVPRARAPPDTVNPPVAVDTVIFAVPSNNTPPIVRAV